MEINILYFIPVAIFSAILGFWVCAALVAGSRADEDIEAAYWRSMYFAEKEKEVV